MKDPPEQKPRKLIDASREYPSAQQRAAQWQKEFEAEGRAFRGAFEHAAIGMGLVDLDGRFLKVNRSVSRIVGYSEAELLSMDFQSLTHPDDLQANLDVAAQLMRGETDHYALEKRCYHKLGHLIWIQLSVSIVRDKDGSACFFVSQVQDITARKQAEDDAARQLRHVERLTEIVPRLLHAFETTPDDSVYSEVLAILVNSFASQAAIFLRFAADGVLIGRFLSPEEDRDARCVAPHRCTLWAAALLEDRAQFENAPGPLGYSRTVSRSLIAPIRHSGAPLGFLHVGDAETDYDADDLDLLKRVSSMIAPVVAARMERDKLTPREAEVMDLIVSGKTQKQIAAQLEVGIQTAAKHRAKVLEKLQVRNDVELAHLALQMRRLPQ